MTTPRDPDEILAAWLDEGPDRLPEQTRRAIAVALPTTTRRRRGLAVPWRYPNMNGPLRLALGAVAIVAVALGGLSLFGRSPNVAVASPSPLAPSPASASSDSPSAVPALTQTFTSRWYGYSVRYPADPWGTVPATTQFDPVAWAAANGPTSWMDVIRPVTDGFLRIASARVPDGQDGETWMATYFGPDCSTGCEDVVIDGQPGRLSVDPYEIEATVIVDERAYVFTLFTGQGEIKDGRALFDAFGSAAYAPAPRAIVAKQREAKS